MKRNPLLNLSNKVDVGIYSTCSANEMVIEAALEFARDNKSVALIESTANQVDQNGGYTGMTPAGFRDYVYTIADKVGLDREDVILGGDHLGPLTWTHLNEDEAMENATTLVYDYARAGFTKIHLDTSMRVADDSRDEALSDETIARRSAMLAKSVLKGYEDLLEENPKAMFPAFIIGSEVPIPGGAQDDGDTFAVTTPEAFKTTYSVFEKTFKEHGVSKVFENVIGIVVQPGVEYGDDEIDHYDREAAKVLTTTLKKDFETLVFEGHSTDYQTPEHLRQLVEDGITILKVGPALTFALREALFALSHIEDYLVEDPSNFVDTLEEAMLAEPKNWKNHYHGTDKELFLKRKFSYSDRARYYLPVDSVNASFEKLVKNLNSVEIPMTLLSQYMPYQFRRVKEGLVENNPEALMKDYVKLYYEDYKFATHSEKLSQ